LKKIAVQTWISEVNVYITMNNFKDISAPNIYPDIVLKKYNSCCKIFLPTTSPKWQWHTTDNIDTYKLGSMLRKVSSIPTMFLESVDSNSSRSSVSWRFTDIYTTWKYDEAYQSYVRGYNSPRGLLNDNASLTRVLCLIYKFYKNRTEIHIT
jgi:hypothetical protein